MVAALVMIKARTDQVSELAAALAEPLACVVHGLDEARTLNSDARLDDELEMELPPQEFGRIAAQAAKQNIIQKVREAERTIICGAQNHQPGDKVPLILPNFALPMKPGDKEPFVIKERKVFGITSQGMMCSPKELGLSGDADGLLILPPDAIIGQPAAQPRLKLRSVRVRQQTAVDPRLSALRDHVYFVAGLQHRQADRVAQDRVGGRLRLQTRAEEAQDQRIAQMRQES